MIWLILCKDKPNSLNARLKIIDEHRAYLSTNPIKTLLSGPLTDKEGNDLIKGKRSKGCLLVFPSFLSHRVTPIIKGTRYSIITWMEGDTFR